MATTQSEQYKSWLNGLAHMRLVEARQERDELLAACEFYADDSNWEDDIIDIGVGNQDMPGSSECDGDRGRVAKAAIAKVKGENGEA